MDQLLVFSILFLLPIILLPLLKLSKHRSTKPNKLPPGPWKLPIIGSMHHLIGELPHHRLSSLAKTYGPLFHLKLGEVDLMVITSPELACEVMKTHDINFASRPRLLAGKLIMYNNSDIVFAPYGKYWWQLRKICSMNILSAKRVKSFSFIRVEEGDNLVKKIRMAAGSPVNLTEMILSAANSTVAKAVFGKECAHQEKFFSTMREIMSLSSGFNLVDVFPSWGFLGVISGLRYRMERAHRNVDAILTQIIEEHQAKDTTGDGMDEDLVDSLLRIKRYGEMDDVHLTLDNVKAVILNLFIGGTDTTSGTLTWAMTELIRHPEIMKKAQLEVRKFFNEKTRKADMDGSKVRYLNCIIKETLRLHTVTPLLVPRVCHERINLSGYTIPADSRVVVNARAIMRDPKFWVNPECFQPDRFEDNSLDFKDANFQYIPFGAGRRICPGISFAVANIGQLLAQLLFNFNWDLPENLTLNDLDLDEVFGATVVKKNALHLVATPHM